MNGIVQLQGVLHSELRQTTARGRVEGDQIQLFQPDGVKLGENTEPFHQVIVVDGDPVKVGREIGEVPPAHQEVGSLAEWLRGVPEHRFYGANGRPDYNGILADLCRQSWATFPDSLEDSRMPNLSTFQRAVARERASRDGQLEPQLYLALPELHANGAVLAMMERDQERDVRVYSGVAHQSEPAGEPIVLADPSSGNIAVVGHDVSQTAAYTVAARVLENPEYELSSQLPTAQEICGSLAGFLRNVPDERFYNQDGNPNYNGIFADLARLNGAAGPEALEDGTLPNVSTFPRAVARERASRDEA
ncbi:MAG: hypothetical protein AB1758_09165, partial [Candidatus Eremiobacterota bacterium]